MKNKSMYVFLYMMLGLFAGMASPIQTSINSELRNALQSPFVASLISFLVGMFVLLFLTTIIEHRRLFHLNNLQTAKIFVTGSPWWLWTGGILGVIFITSNILLLPIVGASLTVVLALSGQMIIALIIDHFGWFGIPKHRLNVQRILGIALMITGIMIIQHF
ncbi:DMT family transporter [Bacillus haynesii]|uniref:DMT family transporter n=1 Tax=Bacillus haynesii TaxID=1925021 RepID=UPI001593A064|nr:DMT family transporter [Bacillus haynesii]NVB33263.1 DMT family transporter [Bacillus licheniformis]MCY7779603.1 DMT family transporter [Bacillus haynesii]MCY7815642.1 DMT family transporter [Bacillus haynesii]MCY8225263.1 DMT family transporter [Bacillus haynesii]MCY8243061.1 DMT family transporter [Bacillus haynesii]